MQDENPRLLRESEAARMMGMSQRTLQAWRLNGTGPRYAKLGKAVRYARADIDAFVNAQSQPTTREVS